MEKEEGASREDTEGFVIRIESKSTREGGAGLQREFWRICIKNLIAK